MSDTTTAAEIRPGLYIDGEWSTGSGAGTEEVRSPWDGELLATVPIASAAEVDRAVAAAARAAREPLPPYRRFEVLSGAAAIIEARAEEFARTIVAESGKPLRDARGEVTRAVQTLRLCGEEAKRLVGETVPFDATPGAESKVGFTLAVPTGPVCAITPFNAPLNQINHKVPTAIAAGCPAVLKPAEATPLSAIALVEALVEAGLPAGYLHLVLGPGETVGEQLLQDERFAAYSFTGSVAVGRHIRRTVGLRKTLLELGNSAANVVHVDADLPRAATAIARSAFAFSGQLCISAQRAIVHADVAAEFVGLLAERVGELRVGDPALEDTDVGPMIDDGAAARAEEAVARAVREGATLVAGGGRDGRLFQPTVLTGVGPEMGIACEEAFAPVLAVMTYSTLEEAVEIANATRYGLQAAVFTETIDVAFHLAARIVVGGVMVNEGSQFRIDQMPFGGVKDSGVGREGVRYAIEEFTDQRLVAFDLRRPAGAGA
ncbi:MAG: aldehyde dehydrogenase family protein [Actinobacteria bacterium]|nr:aldehyde dehydrogenase family protein [Actinomycetota bacterium]